MVNYTSVAYSEGSLQLLACWFGAMVGKWTLGHPNGIMTRCQCYKTFSSSHMKEQNKLECLSLAIF